LPPKTFDVTLDLETHDDVHGGSVKLPFHSLERSPVVDALRRHGAVWILAVNRGIGVLPLRLAKTGSGYRGEILRAGVNPRGSGDEH
jgi:hypothetical protein